MKIPEGLLKQSHLNNHGEPSDELVTFLGDIVIAVTEGTYGKEIDPSMYTCVVTSMQDALQHLEVHPPNIERRPYMEGAHWRLKLSNLRVRGATDYRKDCLEAAQNNEAGSPDGDFC